MEIDIGSVWIPGKGVFILYKTNKVNIQCSSLKNTLSTVIEKKKMFV